MLTLKQEVSKPELTLTNPRGRFWDAIPSIFKVWIKENLSRSPHHNLIIPATEKHSSWVLGAQPGLSSIEKVHQEGNGKKIHIVSMLASIERAMDLKTHPRVETISRMPWFDHSALSLTTGKNQTAASMHNFQNKLYPSFKTSENQPTTFYCHCMAGHTRAFIETMAFIYFYPDKKELFDFDDPSWQKTWEQIEKKLGKENVDNLKDRLQDNPSFRDIAEFVTIQRSKVKKFKKLDNDQAGLVGLMALSKIAEDPQKNIMSASKDQLVKNAQDISLMLKAALDQGFRNEDDRTLQSSNFVEVFRAYYENGHNLLMDMLPEAPFEDPSMTFSDRFEERFRNLLPSEQARLAIFMKELEEKLDNYSNPLEAAGHYVTIALEHTKKLTAGDQVELLRTFSKSHPEILNIINYETIAKKIARGNPIDRYHAGIQLVELYKIAKTNNTDTYFIGKAIKRLDYKEQYAFLNQLATTTKDNHEITQYAQMVLDNYSHRNAKFFNNPLSPSEIKILEHLATGSFNPKIEPQSKPKQEAVTQLIAPSPEPTSTPSPSPATKSTKHNFVP